MATLNQIKVNTGTEDNPSYVLHDVHDKRLDDGASSLVTTCTHLLATNAALSSFNPITSVNLASVLGAPTWIALTSTSDLNECFKVGAIYFNNGAATTNMLNLPSGISNYFCVWTVRQGNSGTAANRYIQFCQDFTVNASTNLLHLYFRLRFPAGNWARWNEFTTKLHS